MEVLKLNNMIDWTISQSNQKKLYERVIKVSIHELGHNLGIPHCTSDRKCLMNDKKGKIKQVDQELLFICK
jgi:archaemetzincin